MLTLNSIVDVRVNVSPVSASGTGFSTGLILAPAAGSSVTETQRLRLFASAADLLADPSGDFDASSPAYLAAKSYFEADPARTGCMSPCIRPPNPCRMPWTRC